MFDPFKEAQKIDDIINDLKKKYPIAGDNDQFAERTHAYQILVSQLTASVNMLRHMTEEAAQYIDE